MPMNVTTNSTFKIIITNVFSDKMMPEWDFWILPRCMIELLPATFLSLFSPIKWEDRLKAHAGLLNISSVTPAK